MTLVTLVSLLLALVTANAPPASSAPSGHVGRPAAGPSPEALVPDELFSRRALRRARLLIQMRMLQLRDERLDCIRAALYRQLPDVLRPEAAPSRDPAGLLGCLKADRPG